HQALDAADVAVGGLHAVAPADLDLAQRDGVGGDDLRLDGPVAPAAAGHAHPAACQAVVGHVADLARAVAAVGVAGRDDLGVLGRVEVLELRLGAAEPDLARRGVNQI